MSYRASVLGKFITVPPAGESCTFMMGSPLVDHRQPLREVTLQPFALQKTPVTVDQFIAHIEESEKRGQDYGRVLYGPGGQIQHILWGDSPSDEVKCDVGQKVSRVCKLVPTLDEFKRRFARLENGAAVFLHPDHPVVNVAWGEAAVFAFLIGGRLPTEAEWECAARAGRAGNEVYGTDTGELTAENAHWNKDETTRATVPVASYAPNPWGLYDMSGNVWEWVQGWYVVGAAAREVASAGVDPLDPPQGVSRVARGGAYFNKFPWSMLAASRCGLPHDPRGSNYYPAVGFRVARSL